MSVVVAIKENGVVYIGADSQTTAGKRKYHYLNESEYKIKRIDNGMLVSFCGSVAAEQSIPKSIFTLDENGELNKRHIVKEIIPNLVDKMNEIGDTKKGEMEVSILLAYKDILYRITKNLDVVRLNENAKAGAGLYFVDYALSLKELPVRERILKALVESAKRTDSVGGPFVLIDTKDREYEIIDLGGENY